MEQTEFATRKIKSMPIFCVPPEPAPKPEEQEPVFQIVVETSNYRIEIEIG